ncbi:MAG: hypothetical protein Q7R41_01540 [Phycisphaerales bacterium]|nr:hypothetical protein [Phycisphaerales bacterium]
MAYVRGLGKPPSTLFQHYNATLLMDANWGGSHFRPLQRPFAAEGGVAGQPFYGWQRIEPNGLVSARFNGLSDPRDN